MSQATNINDPEASIPPEPIYKGILSVTQDMTMPLQAPQPSNDTAYGMTTSFLARWLNDNRSHLLPRWITLLEQEPHQANSNDGAVHPNEQTVLIKALYDGMIHAAEGDTKPLDECLRLFRALRTTADERELTDRLAMTFQLRRAAWDLVFAGDQDAATTHTLLEELEQLIEHTTMILADRWTESANSVAHRLSEFELDFERLNEVSAHADRLVLQTAHLNQLATTLASSLDPDYLLEAVGSKLYESGASEHVAIWLLDAKHNLSLISSWGTPKLGPDMQLGDAETDLVQLAFGKGVLQSGTHPEPTTQGTWYQPDHAVLAAPMLAQDRALGVIVLQDSDTERFDRTWEDFVRSAASQAAIALQNAGLYATLEERIAQRTEELQTERDILETLRQVALEVGGTLDLDLLLDSCLQLLGPIIGAQYGSVMLLDQETEQLVNRAVLGAKTRDLRGFARFPMGQGLVGWVAKERESVIVPNVAADPRWIELPEGTSSRKRQGSMVAVPLIGIDSLLGVLLFSHKEEDQFRTEHLRLLNASARQIAIGINNAQLYENIEQEWMLRSDMSRRQEEAASQSQAILQSLSDGVIVCNADGYVLAANPAVERILDRSVEELLTWRLPDLFDRLLGSRTKDVSLASLLVTPRDTYDRIRTLSVRFQIGPRVITLTVDPVLLRRNEVMGAVAVFRDITREVEAGRIKDEFIGTVSHELRTPMTSIKGYIQLLLMGGLGPLTDSQKEFVQVVHNNTDRMISIINDLLDITKLETGSIELDYRPLHVAEALGNVIVDLQPIVQNRGHELTINIPPGLPLVRADAQRFNQVLRNIISNAVRYTPQCGRITIEAHDVTEATVPVRLREHLRAGRYVQIDVRDNGLGIAAHEQELIFERFYRTENPLKIEAGGTGLGLALVRPLIHLFGGQIWLDSTPDEGTTFSFVVPVA